MRNTMAYQPNWNKKSTLKRVEKVLNFVELYTKTSQRKWISSQELYKHFGNTSRQPGKYLKEKLLIVADPYYNSNTGVCIKYLRNDAGVKEVKQLCGMLNFTPVLNAQLEEQLDTGNFDYKESSNRSFNGLQYIPKQIRGSLLSNKGYKYHYDIEAAAPTLLIQKAYNLNPSLDIQHLNFYTQNRSQVRQLIAQETGLSENQIKTVINGVLLGGRVSSWQGNKIFEQLNYSYPAVVSLKASVTFCQIKEDISVMWKSLKNDFPIRYQTDKNGRVTSKRLSAKDKSNMYFELESQIGNVIRKLLRKRKIRALWIHDGWCCDKMIDPIDVQDEVRRTTGYSIKLEWNIYKDL